MTSSIVVSLRIPIRVICVQDKEELVSIAPNSPILKCPKCGAKVTLETATQMMPGLPPPGKTTKEQARRILEKTQGFSRPEPVA